MSERMVLMVDDSPEDRATFRRYLSRAEERTYRILEAASGRAALEYLRHATPDCILLDFYLPDMDGMAVLAALKGESDTPRYPVVMLTGSGSTALAVHAMQQGAQDYLTKESVTAQTLTRAIENAIEKHQLHRQLEAQHQEILRRNTELEAANRALQESETRFRTLVDGLPNLIWNLDVENRTILVNRAWTEFMGCALEQAARFDWQEAIHPDDRERVIEEFLRSSENRKPYQSEYRIRHGNGKYRLLLSSAVPHFSSEGAFAGYLGSSLDVTDQRALQEQLFESQKLESLGRLAGGVAHDFNNLLTAILGYTELAQTFLAADAEVRPFLDNVSAAGQRAAELTKQLLMYARRQMVEFTIVDMHKVILEIHPLLRRTIGEQYELVTALAEDLCCVHANVSQMEQVLTNLVVNARDAMPEGGRILIETGGVFLDAEYAQKHIGVVPGEYVMVSVSDDGIGMTKEVQERIFEPFYTTKEVGKGTGLGLATCYGIVKQSKGNIWVYSEPDKGTTFKVYLPRIYNPVNSASVPLYDNLPEGTETILLVDDEPMVRDIASRTLRAQGYRVLEASNGAEALHRQSEWPGELDLLLTDVVMPLMGGKELAGRLQELHPGLKVLYMSGYTQNVVLNQGVIKPGMLLLTKPFTASDLFLKVREALG